MFRPDQFMVVAFTEHQPAKRSLGHAWPQHMTVLPWMTGYRSAATNRIAVRAADIGPLQVDITGEDRFGAKGETRAWTLGPCQLLKSVYLSLRDAAICNGTEWAADIDPDRPFRPHVTIKPEQPEHTIGDRLLLPELSVIGYNEVLGKIVFENIAPDAHETAA